MPYISTEQVAAIRTQLKKEFPNVVFSVTRQHHMKVNVAIMKCHIDFLAQSKITGINEYHINDAYTEEAKTMLKKVLDIMQGQDYNSCEYESADYGEVPSYYVDLSIGKWDKPYICTAKTAVSA